jgi:putative flippase GtrA
MLLKFFSKGFYFQMVKFVISGLISAVLEIGLLIGFVDILKVEYLKANVLVFAIGGPINFIMNKYWVFEKGALKGLYQVAGFVTLALANLGFNQFMLWVFVEYFLIDYKISKILAIGLGVVLNFVIKKYFIFETNKRKAEMPYIG